MFKNKKTKAQSLNTVENLLSTYLQTTDKKITKNKEKINKSKHEASKIIEMNSKIGKFKENSKSLKKSKQKDRKIRNKIMKDHELINEKIIRQSKLDGGDSEIINEIVNDKLKDLRKIDAAKADEDLIDLQNDILNLSNVDSTKKKLKDLKDRELLLKKRNNAKLNAFNEKISNGNISISGLTPGLAQPGDDDSDSDDDDDDDDGADNGLSGFKDDFDDYN